MHLQQQAPEENWLGGLPEVAVRWATRAELIDLADRQKGALTARLGVTRALNGIVSLRDDLDETGRAIEAALKAGDPEVLKGYGSDPRYGFYVRSYLKALERTDQRQAA